MPSTLSDLRSQVIAEFDIDPNQRIFSTTTINRNINRALRKIQQDANYALPENRAVYTFTPSSQEQNLPSDFKRIGSPHAVKLGENTPLYPVDYFDVLGGFSLTANSGQATAYYVRNSGTQWIMGFYPVPNTSQVVTVPYYKALTEFSADTDESPLDEDYDEAIVQYAAYLTIRRKQGFEQKTRDHLAFYTEAINDVRANRQTYNEYDLKVGYARPDRYRFGPRQVGDNYKGL